jgi:hypothetical protein
MHDDDEAVVKLVSNNVSCYAKFVIYPYLLNILQDRYMHELRKIHESHQEDLRFMPFNVNAAWNVCENIDCFLLIITCS